MFAEFEDLIRRTELLETIRKGADPNSIDWTYNARYLTDLDITSPRSTCGVIVANTLALPRFSVVQSGFALMRHAASFGVWHSLCRELGSFLLVNPPASPGVSFKTFPAKPVRDICARALELSSGEEWLSVSKISEGAGTNDAEDSAHFFLSLEKVCHGRLSLQMLSIMDWTSEDMEAFSETLW